MRIKAIAASLAIVAVSVVVAVSLPSRADSATSRVAAGSCDPRYPGHAGVGQNNTEQTADLC